MAKYSKKSQSKVKRAMHEKKAGTLKSGRSGKKVTSRKQAIAIGLSEARKEGAKVPKKKSASKKSAGRKSSSGRKSSTGRKSSRGRKKSS
jgi:hypothetical protein